MGIKSTRVYDIIINIIRYLSGQIPKNLKIQTKNLHDGTNVHLYIIIFLNPFNRRPSNDRVVRTQNRSPIIIYNNNIIIKSR